MFAVMFDPWMPYYPFVAIIVIVWTSVHLFSVYNQTARISWGGLTCCAAILAIVLTLWLFPPIARVREAAMRRYLPEYIAAARSDDPESRQYGIRGLCEIIQGSEQEYLRDAAFETLVAVKADEAVPSLVQLVEDSDDADLKRRARRALDEIKAANDNPQQHR